MRIWTGIRPSHHLWRSRRAYATVNWNQWSPKAFEQAQRENKCLFVSSISHSEWCDLMSKEAFADSDVVTKLNSEFVPVRIHKDEDRGIDKSLMMFMQLKAKGQGGWPLNTVLTPTKFQPFIAASYLSAEDLKKFLDIGHSTWSDDSKLCEKAAAEATHELVALRDSDHGKTAQLDIKDSKEQAVLQYRALADRSPRFVMGYALSELGGELCTEVLHAIAPSGVIDQLSGGVYAYSISSDWHFPNLQKTLSGQATLLMACATQLEQSKGNDPVVLALADNVAQYMVGLAPFTSEFCGGDLWKFDEFTEALQADLNLLERDIAQNLWGVNENGNINPELDPLKTCFGLNVLTQHKSVKEVAATFGVSPERATEIFEKSRQLLQQYKTTGKEAPVVNRRIVLGDLGLALSALSRVAKFVPGVKQAAKDLAESIKVPAAAPLNDKEVCEDYAFAIMGLLDYHEHIDSQNQSWLEAANTWQKEQLAKFADPTNAAGFFFSQNIPNLYFRPKFTYDGAEPNYNGITSRNLHRLSQHSFDYTDLANRTQSVGVHGSLTSPLAHLSFLYEV